MDELTQSAQMPDDIMEILPTPKRAVATQNGRRADSDVKSSKPKFWPWPRPQRFGLDLGLEALASASNIWPRPGHDLM